MRHYDEPRDSDPPVKHNYSFSYDELNKKQTFEERQRERQKAIKIAIETLERMYGKDYVDNLRKAKSINKTL